ncbi:GspE/PulE family protein [Phycisphaerales bacterium AB-hyl4]|uniref:GspE/PulE family protein n=1 Tax=Natronomicrosphaera hydrolytica TaxID=3242702 RepID=A0ABV4U372_9BACT
MPDDPANNVSNMMDRFAPESGPAQASSLSDLWTPDDEPAAASVAHDMGQALLDAGVITPAQLTNIRAVAKKSPGRSLAEIAMDLGADEARVQAIIAGFAGMPFEEIDPATVDAIRQINKLGLEFCQANGVLPLRVAGARVVLGVTHPDNLLVIDEVRHKLGQSVKPVVVTAGQIAAFIESRKEEESDEEVEVDDIIGDMAEDEVEVVETEEEDLDLEKMAGESPVIRLVNYLIFNAVKEGASDIHIEPQEKRLQVRYRIDGVLFDTMSPPHHMHAAIISRLKIMANLDISERRLPQDGRIRAVVHGRKLDLRLSTLPTAAGEKAVLRILDTRSIQVPLDELGMGEDALLMWKRQIDQPHGILLVTGPTGSGKTTTLYASLAQMDKRKLNISTVEDPVEYHLNGINQTQTHERIGMSFSAALRALLRQDPDVIMVGEIRDSETARIAIQASLTGHLVLSTLHTNDAPSSVTRLINIGVEPYLIGAAVNGAMAQRLVRKICTNCAKQVPPDDVTANHLAMHGIALDEVMQGEGCDKCRNTGYAGRLGLYELLLLDDTLRDRIAGNPNVTEFRRTCVERGMVTLREDGFRKVAAGQTTVEEVLRVTESTI